MIPILANEEDKKAYQEIVAQRSIVNKGLYKSSALIYGAIFCFISFNIFLSVIGVGLLIAGVYNKKYYMKNLILVQERASALNRKDLKADAHTWSEN